MAIITVRAPGSDSFEFACGGNDTDMVALFHDSVRETLEQGATMRLLNDAGGMVADGFHFTKPDNAGKTRVILYKRPGLEADITVAASKARLWTARAAEYRTKAHMHTTERARYRDHARECDSEASKHAVTLSGLLRRAG